MVKNSPATQETQEMWVRSLNCSDPQEKEMATHSNILAWRIPWTEEPGGLQSMGLQRIGHDSMHAFPSLERNLAKCSRCMLTKQPVFPGLWPSVLKTGQCQTNARHTRTSWSPCRQMAVTSRPSLKTSSAGFLLPRFNLSM